MKHSILIRCLFAACAVALFVVNPATATTPLGGLTVAISPDGKTLVAGGDTLIAAGTGLISLAIASVVSLVVVALAWFVYRPLLGIVLFVIAGAIAVFALMKIRAAKAATPAPAQ